MRTILLKMATPVLLLGLSATALAATPRIVSEKAASVSGKVETTKEAGMMWYQLNTGMGKPLLIGAVYGFSGATAGCLEKAAATGNPATVSGKLTMYDNNTGGFDVEDLQCSVSAGAPVVAPAAPVATVAAPPVSGMPAAPMAAVSGRPLKLDEKLHSQLMQDDNYRQADSMLNSTWKQVKANMSEEQYKQILQDQRQWANQGRDAAASLYAASMPVVEAFTRAMQDRTDALVQLVAVPPAAGTFEMSNGEFTVSIQGKTLSVVGDAFRGQNVCNIEGKGTVGRGWITVENDIAKFYVLFTRKGAQVTYFEDQGCGVGVQFAGSYTKK